MKSASCKAKGRVLQNWICDLIRTLFSLSPEDVKPAIMGESGMDIKLSSEARKRFYYAIEAKNTEHLNVWQAWDQAQANADKEGLIPMLIVKRNRSSPLVVMEAERTLALIMELQYVKGNIPTQNLPVRGKA